MQARDTTIPEQIAREAAALPLERQREVLDFVAFLRTRPQADTNIERARVAGVFAGQPYTMEDDFDAPLPDAFWLGDRP